MRWAPWFAALMFWAPTTAHPADLPPPIEPPPFIARWSGIYGAFGTGGVWGQSNWESTGGFSETGWLVSGSVGYNYQIGNFVIGGEGDLNWSNLSGGTKNNCPAGCETKTDFFSSLRARAGFRVGNLLPYVTIGPAVGSLKASTLGLSGIDTIRTGWVLGAGLDYAFSPAWAGRIEYLHIDLGSSSCGLSCGLTAPNDVSQRADVIKVGVVYQLNPPPIEPPPFGNER